MMQKRIDRMGAPIFLTDVYDTWLLARGPGGGATRIHPKFMDK